MSPGGGYLLTAAWVVGQLPTAPTAPSSPSGPSSPLAYHRPLPGARSRGIPSHLRAPEESRQFEPPVPSPAQPLRSPSPQFHTLPVPNPSAPAAQPSVGPLPACPGRNVSAGCRAPGPGLHPPRSPSSSLPPPTAPSALTSPTAECRGVPRRARSPHPQSPAATSARAAAPPGRKQKCLRGAQSPPEQDASSLPQPQLPPRPR